MASSLDDAKKKWIELLSEGKEGFNPAEATEADYSEDIENLKCYSILIEGNKIDNLLALPNNMERILEDYHLIENKDIISRLPTFSEYLLEKGRRNNFSGLILKPLKQALNTLLNEKNTFLVNLRKYGYETMLVFKHFSLNVEDARKFLTVEYSGRDELSPIMEGNPIYQEYPRGSRVLRDIDINAEITGIINNEIIPLMNKYGVKTG